MAETRRHALARNDAAISGIMVISATPAWLIAIRTRSPRREMIQFDRISRFLGTSREKFTPSHPGIAAARYSAGFLEFPTCVYLLPIFSPPRRVSTERATPKLRSSRDVRNRCWLRWLSSSFRSQLLPSRYQRTNFVMCVYIYIYMCVCVCYMYVHIWSKGQCFRIFLEIVSRTCLCLVFHYRYSELYDCFRRIFVYSPFHILLHKLFNCWINYFEFIYP